MTNCRIAAHVAAWMLLFASAGRPAVALEIELPYFGLPLPPPILSGIALSSTIATDTWEGLFHDSVSLKFAVTAMPLPPGALGYFDVEPTTSAFDYSSVATALAADKTSAADFSAVSALQPGPALSVITIDTTTAPTLRTFISTSETYNSSLRLTRANQKALGLLAPHDGGLGADGTIVINSTMFPLMDFDPSDGIAPGMLDFTAILVHEMGHGMGFISGVDHIDYASSDGAGHSGPDFPHDYSDETIFTVLDLYRYSAESVEFISQPASGATLDWAAGSSPIFGDNPFFSVDGGDTSLALFSTGVLFGDGYQAQHWKDSAFLGSPIGLMDPEIDTGELGAVSALDVTALDVIGWNLVPEPSGLVLTSFALAATLGAWKRRKGA